jgi:hypothetical protein
MDLIRVFILGFYRCETGALAPEVYSPTARGGYALIGPIR